MQRTALRMSSQLEEDTPPWWETLEELLEALRPRLTRILYCYSIPPEDAEDLLQTTLLTLCYKRAGIHDPEAWLAGTLRNRCLMYWRARRASVQWVTSTELVAALAEVHDPNQLLGKRLQPEDPSLRWDLARALDRLPQPWAQVVRLRILAGCSQEETAAVTGYKASGIRKTLARSLKRLRSVMEEGDEGSLPRKGRPRRERRRSGRRTRRRGSPRLVHQEPPPGRDQAPATPTPAAPSSPPPPRSQRASRPPHEEEPREDRNTDLIRRLEALQEGQEELAREVREAITRLRRSSPAVEG